MSSRTSLYFNNLSEQSYRPSTLIELLRWRAESAPGKLGYIYLADGDTEEVSLTYRELDRRARAIAAKLQRATKRGDRALLLYPPGLDYVAAFFGCLYAGLIAVPAYPPDPSRFSRSLPRLQTMVADSRAGITLTTETIRARATSLAEEEPLIQALNWMSSDELEHGLEDEWREQLGSKTELAFLQYTSGSTGTPKGVMLSHENLLHNASLVYHGVEHRTDDKYVSWLPTFHDMGFMAGILQPLYAEIPVVSMSPVAFLQRPLLWLQAISRYQATTSGGPNFAYDLCVRKITPEQRAELDLSHWTVAFNGAEPIREETLDRFAETFASCGFKREAFYPCYGLAEATLIVTGSHKSQPPVVKRVEPQSLENNQAVDARAESEGRSLVGCGHVLLDQQVAVVHPENLTRCAPGEIGEIWVAGSSVAQGYWNKPEETEQTFHAYLLDTGEGPFLRTGDLGFISDGELYVAGRLKDLIIIRGLNHYPQDIELSVERSHPALRAGCGAAFAIEVESEERLVIVQEIDYRKEPDLNEVIEGIRTAVAAEHELHVYAIALIKAGRIPKTTSGKIQRRASRAAFLGGTLDLIAEWRADAVPTSAPTSEAPPVRKQTAGNVIAWLILQMAARPGVLAHELDINQPIARYGLDSLAAIELMHKIETDLGVVLPMTALLQSYSITELATLISERSAAASSEASPGRPQEPNAQFPLSYGQRALWFVHQLAPESPVYNISAAVKIASTLDVGRFRLAFEKIVKRHPALRTTFSIVENEPVQTVHDACASDFHEADAAAWSEASLRERLVQDANRPFDLEHGPLLRVYLYRRSSDEHVLLLVVHHIVADFWSLAIVLRELGQFYSSERSDKQSFLSHPSSSYADHVHSQAQILASGERDRLWTHWQKQLAGVPYTLELPTDHHRPPVQTYRGSSVPFKLNAELTAKLRALAQTQGATLYMTLLACFQVLLHRYTNQDQFLVGSPTAGRGRAGLADVVGYFVNPIALRADFSQDPTFAQHLDRVRQNVLDAFEHQEYPFPLLVERLQPERDPSRSPLFQAVFALQKTKTAAGENLSPFALGESGARFNLGPLSLETVALDERVAQFDLTLMMSEENDALAASLQYNLDLFDYTTIERMATHFQTLVEAIVSDPQKPVSALPLLPAAELQQLLVDWNDTKSDDASPACVHSLFEVQAAQTAEATAVVCGHESLTYRELNARANQLARYLRRAGVGPEVTVGILTERSIDMVVALLSVLKTGGAYLPLDPANTHERLAFMLRDSGAPVLLTQESLAQSFRYEDRIKGFCLDIDWQEIAKEDDTDLDSEASPANLAYVIYTSGSTGQPKGVAITHAGLANLIAWHQRAYGVTSGDRATQLAGPAFDASVWELWPYLTIGAAIHIPDEETRVSPFKLVQWLAENAITICFLPTPLAEAVLQETLLPSLSLRAILTGGDVLHRRPPAALPFMLVNHYGPTENTVVTTRALITADADAAVAPPIGSPIANTQCFLLNEHLQPVPVGVPGELFISGVGLARGYHDRPELTAEKFLPNPFSTSPGARLYRTGDLARYLPDGQIEFLGRFDYQVKIRGFRIELGEIESVLRTHPHVRETVVVAWEETPGNTRLAAYVVPSSSESTTIEQLQSFLREKLPEYMVPAAFLFLSEMPLTPNGKIDRSALPAPAEFALQPGVVATLPRTPMEELVAGIWCQVLAIEQVGTHDNFFELGGHSLLATQVISRIRETLNVDVSLRSLFIAPTVAALAEQVAKALNVERGPGLPALAPVLRDHDLPLSFAQQRLWFLDQLEPGNSLYNIPAALRLRGRLNTSALEQALDEIARRHESLRTVFKVVKGEPVQVIAAPQRLPLPVVDLRQLPESERTTQANAQMLEEVRRPFDLTDGLLMRVSLLQVKDDEHVLLLTMHHIISDGWSVGVLLRELTTLYTAYAACEPSPLPELPIQYADFAQWQREWLNGETLDKQLDYWRRQLAGAPLLPQLPTDRVRPAVQTFRGARVSQAWNEELRRQLKHLSQQEGVTLYMTLLAAFQLLLTRWSGQEEVVVGAPIAGRTQIETESLIGFFVNTLVLRMNMSGNPSVRELLQRVREVCLQAYAHQDVPFEKLVEELQPERNLSHSPLFQVMFAQQDLSLRSLSLSDVEIAAVESDTTTSKFDLTLFVSESEHGFVGSIEYNTDLFDESTIRRLFQHYTHLLEALVNANTEQQLSMLNMLSVSEQQQILHDWNQTASDYPRERLLHQWFEAQVERTPDAIALVCGAQQLTYAELNERANQQAHRLRTLGVTTETRVGVMLERTPLLLTGLLAVFKAGGAYVPLDPHYPQQRVSFMLSDAEVQVLLTTSDLASTVDTDVQVLCLDREAIGTSVANPVSAVHPENLSYVIYTSGSTGIPKGVAITHGNASAFIYWAIDFFSPEKLQAVLASTSINFDLSIFELFVPLSVGGCVILADNALHLPALPSASMVELVNTVPSAMAELIRQRAVPPSVRVINLAGEALSRKLVQEIYSLGTVEQVINLYGPSEDTTYSTYEIVPRAADETVLIGCPIANTQIYLVDAEMQPVAVGVAGELLISGDGLARGYLNRPELTAERFIPNSFTRQPGARLYRTGDLARYRDDGRIEYLGRIDHQIKIRGFRIELGEIEAQLERHSCVQQCVVTANDDATGNKRLGAYVVAKAGETITLSELRAFLKERLPEYMVPSAFVLLDELPLTPNGKVDRKRLPAVDISRDELAAEFVAPRTPAEEVVAGVWAEVLKVERVGVLDNFFELGGHSLLATQVISRLRDAFETELTLRSLFEEPTVAALAARIADSLNQQPEVQRPPLQPIARDGNLDLSFTQQRLWFLDQLEPGSAFYNIAAAVQLDGKLNVAALEESFAEVVKRHESLRTRFTAIDGSPFQIVEEHLPFALTETDLSTLPETEGQQELQRLAAEEAQRSFDLTRGPLLRAGLIKLSDTQHVLLLTMHHIVSDGWSIGVLIQELAALYSAFSKGQSTKLPELPIQYADFAHWQRQWLAGPALPTQIDYWLDQLKDAPAMLELPTDRPRPAVQSFRGSTESFSLPTTLSESLKAFSRSEGVTLFTTLMAALQTLFYRYTGQDDFMIGSPIANRAHVETEKLIGCFTNTLVLRAKLCGNPSFREMQRRVWETILGAHAHQDIPFERLVEELQPQRDLSRSPLFQVMFVLQNAASESAINLPGLDVRVLETGSGTARFDLTLSMSETSDGLKGTLEYNTDLFDASTIQRLLQHYTHLLQAIIEDADRSLLTLPLLDSSERMQLLDEWNSTAMEYPASRLLHEWFEAQVERTPDSIAVVFAGEQLSYRELNTRANQLAHHLLRLRVGTEAKIGVMLERTPLMLVSLLAALKSGGAYLPLDPNYPQQRIAFMLADAEIEVLLTESQLSERLPENNAAIVRLDREWPTIASTSIENPIGTVDAQNLAYVIYTSGSTGTPKGVAITHRNASAFIQWSHQFFSAEKLQAVLASTSINFDLSVFEMFAPLSCGGRIILAGNALQLPSLAAASEVELINTVPSAMAELVRQRAVPESVRTVNLAGEALSRKLVQDIYGLGTLDEVINLYGPSEDTTYTTYETVSNAAGEPVLIGRPIGNTQIYLLDVELEPVPIGVAGELYTAGEGLARGYLNRPQLTAERFIPNPYSSEPGKRLYRTGDLARYRLDGRIEYLGRIDQQIKIRGFRIELGEIEAVLERHPLVQQCVVTATANDVGDKHLVAYVVGVSQQTISGDLRAYLKEKLPEYMVPSVFVMLAEMPLTPNGKVDRKRLPAPEQVRFESENSFVAPRTKTEETVAAIWSEVLRVDRVSVEDNFFELGGHSLLATQVVSRIKAAFQVEAPLRWLFETSSCAALAAQIDIAAKAQTALTLPPLQRRDPAVVPQLSFTQQRLWFLDQLEPGSAFYNIAAAVRIAGELNKAALERAFQELVRRHESLRTRFVVVDGSPVQVIDPSQAWELPITDLTEIPDAERKFQRLATDEARKPFDLTRGPLLRPRLFRLDQEKHVLLATMHHIISDGWSIRVLMREIAVLVEALSQSKPSPLPELPIQFPDFAEWQRRSLQGELLESQLEYWKQRLAGAPLLLELPVDNPRPAVQTYTGARQSLLLSDTLSDAIKTFSKTEGHTLFVTLLAAFNALLYRYTNQTDIVIGSPVAGRNHLETEDLIGFFANTLVLRTFVSDDSSFDELACRVGEAVMEAQAHQDIPFERLVEELQVARDLSRSPLFQVMFILQNAALEDVTLSGLTLTPMEIDSGTSKFDLTLFVDETNEGLRSTLEYNTDLFEATTITRLLQHFEMLLEGIVSDSRRRLSELPLLNDSERQQLLVDWNDTRAAYGTACVHQLFEAQVERTPDAIALVCGAQQLTYAELNERANQQAHRLRTLGVTTETRVGVMLERTPLLLTGLLAVLKAGGAYVPLDPHYPQQRVSFMLSDAEVQVLLTTSDLASTVDTDVQVLCLDREAIGTSVANPVSVVHPENLSYVIYTSGSTGTPKGVQIPHRAVVNFLSFMQRQLSVSERDVLLSVTSLSFDIAVLELFLPLINGAQVLLMTREQTMDASLLSEQLSTRGATLTQATPATWRMLTEFGWKAQPSLKVLCGGEALSRELAHRLAGDGAELWNLYGPTETTVWSLTTRIEPAEQRMTIGHPMANTQAYVLDAQMRPVPINVPGELYIGGDGLARGYLKRPDLTAERFIPNPFSTTAGARLYRTGDLTRYLDDGRIEYLGRIDQQIKIRGFRIELGEIEAQLERHPQVRQCVVTANPDATGGKRLVAYVVAQNGRTVTSTELRAFVKEQLPEYMVPSAFVLLEELPLTANGKVDRKRLPVAELNRDELAVEFVAPRTPTEETVAGIWASVLKLERVGVLDNFFELGGHSLLATQVMFSLREAFHVELPLRSIFESPTVSDLSQIIEKAKSNGSGAIKRLSRERFRVKAPVKQWVTVPEILRNNADV